MVFLWYFIEMYDIAGRKIKDIFTGKLIAEVKESWNGRSSEGKEVKVGVYFLKSEGMNVEKVIKLR